MAQRVLAGGAGPALEPREGDDVGARLGDPEADRADVRHHRDLDRDADVGVDGLQLVDQLGEVLDRVEVVVVGGRDQVRAGSRVTRGGDLLGDLLAGQVAALAGLRALADLDLGDVGGVDHLGRDPEPARGDLLAAPFAVLAVHVADLAALAVDAEDVDRLRRLGVGAEGRLRLRAEAHRGDHDRVVVVADAGVDVGRVDRVAVALQPHDVAHRDRALATRGRGLSPSTRRRCRSRSRSRSPPCRPSGRSGTSSPVSRRRPRRGSAPARWCPRRARRTRRRPSRRRRRPRSGRSRRARA